MLRLLSRARHARDFLAYGYRAYQPLIASLRFRRNERKGTLLAGCCRSVPRIHDFTTDHVVLVATGTGLLLARRSSVYKLFDSIGYIFGMTIVGSRVFFLHLVQVEGNHKHSEETYRRSEIYSASLDDILRIEPEDKLQVVREYSEEGVLYSFCNSWGNTVYAIDYLGRLSLFEVNPDGSLDTAGAKHFMVNRHFDRSPLISYSYTHFNSVSVHGDTVFLGAHGRKAWTGRFSGIYCVSKELREETLRYIPTPFVHSHDTIVVGGDLYVCDSKNSALVRNDRRLFVAEGAFMRGLSIAENDIIVGLSGTKRNRRDRNQETESENVIVFLNRDGVENQKAVFRSSQIYNNLLLISEDDYSVSELAARRYSHLADGAPARVISRCRAWLPTMRQAAALRRRQALPLMSLMTGACHGFLP